MKRTCKEVVQICRNHSGWAQKQLTHSFFKLFKVHLDLNVSETGEVYLGELFTLSFICPLKKISKDFIDRVSGGSGIKAGEIEIKERGVGLTDKKRHIFLTRSDLHTKEKMEAAGWWQFWWGCWGEQTQRIYLKSAPQPFTLSFTHVRNKTLMYLAWTAILNRTQSEDRTFMKLDIMVII